MDEVTRTWPKTSQIALESAATAIMRAFTIVTGVHEAAYAELDLTLARFAVLATLDRTEEGQMGLTQLSRMSFLHPPTLTYTLDHLEKRGLVRRRQAEGDKRSTLAEITPSGRTIIREAFKRMGKGRYGVAGITHEEAEQLSTLLAKIQNPPAVNGAPTARRPARTRSKSPAAKSA
jgi:DNA-binding MarR family transcriptional regulator